MSLHEDAVRLLTAKDEIRELALLYCRGVDRKDGPLLRTLYTADATDTHGDTYDGDAQGYVDFLERSFPFMAYSGHHVCNHLVSVAGDAAEGEIYALAYHLVPDGAGGWIEDFMAVRYLDRYRREDGCWKFAKRVVTYDLKRRHPASSRPPPEAHPRDDASYIVLAHRAFARGPRA